MQITQEFIELISYEQTLNKEQCKILNLSYPPSFTWDKEILDKEILKNDANRLMLLKGKLAIKAQEQILKNPIRIKPPNPPLAVLLVRRLRRWRRAGRRAGSRETEYRACRAGPGSASWSWGGPA